MPFKSEMADGRHLGKIEKSLYLSRGLSDFEEVCHDDAVRTSWLTKINKISPGSPAVITARIAPKICLGQPPAMYSECSRFHPNRFTFGWVIAERVNTAKTRRKVNPILGYSLASSWIMMTSSSKAYPLSFSFAKIHQWLLSKPQSLFLANQPTNKSKQLHRRNNNQKALARVRSDHWNNIFLLWLATFFYEPWNLIQTISRWISMQII